MTRWLRIAFALTALSTLTGAAAAQDERPDPEQEQDMQVSELEAVVRHEPRSEFFLELPTAYGKLILDLPEPAKVFQSPQMSAEELRAAEQELEAAKKLYSAVSPKASEEAALEVVRRHPLFPAGYGALYDLYNSQQRWDEAEYQLKQLLAIQQRYSSLEALARLLGQRGRLDESLVVSAYLWEHRADAASPAEALGAVKTYLVTLGRAQKGARMAEVAGQALEAFGPDSALSYQQVLGLIVAGDRDEAKRRLAAILGDLDPRDPMRPRFLQMKQVLEQQ